MRINKKVLKTIDGLNYEITQYYNHNDIKIILDELNYFSYHSNSFHKINWYCLSLGTDQRNENFKEFHESNLKLKKLQILK